MFLAFLSFYYYLFLVSSLCVGFFFLSLSQATGCFGGRSTKIGKTKYADRGGSAREPRSAWFGRNASANNSLDGAEGKSPIPGVKIPSGEHTGTRDIECATATKKRKESLKTRVSPSSFPWQWPLKVLLYSFHGLLTLSLPLTTCTYLYLLYLLTFTFY